MIIQESIKKSYPVKVVEGIDKTSRFFLIRNKDGLTTLIQTSARPNRQFSEEMSESEISDNMREAMFMEAMSETPENNLVLEAKRMIIAELGCSGCYFYKKYNHIDDESVIKRPLGLSIETIARLPGERPLSVSIRCRLRAQEVHAGDLPVCLKKDGLKSVFIPEINDNEELPF